MKYRVRCYGWDLKEVHEYPELVPSEALLLTKCLIGRCRKVEIINQHGRVIASRDNGENMEVIKL
jgi:hypothetical protein